MDLSGYKLERANGDSKWDDFVESSCQGTIFSRSDYLKGIGQQAGLWYCLKRQEIKAAIAVMESGDQKSTNLHDFVIYNGIMFAPDHPMQNYSQVIFEQYRCISFIVQSIAEIYDQVCLSLHPSFTDIRPFQWHNYGEDKPHFLIEVRFTSYVNIEGLATAANLEDIPLFNRANTLRRREIRHAIQKQVYTEEKYEPHLFTDFYRMTMERQNKTVEQGFLDELYKVIVNLHKTGLGRMYISYTTKGEPGSIAILGIDSKRAYYLFGASDPKLRENHTGTGVFWDAFHSLNKSGIKEVDLEGINSPQRGYFKLSFGGNIVPYYHLFCDNTKPIS